MPFKKRTYIFGCFLGLIALLSATEKEDDVELFEIPHVSHTLKIDEAFLKALRGPLTQEALDSFIKKDMSSTTSVSAGQTPLDIPHKKQTDLVRTGRTSQFTSDAICHLIKKDLHSLKMDCYLENIVFFLSQNKMEIVIKGKPINLFIKGEKKLHKPMLVILKTIANCIKPYSALIRICAYTDKKQFRKIKLHKTNLVISKEREILCKNVFKACGIDPKKILDADGKKESLPIFLGSPCDVSNRRVHISVFTQP